MKEKVKGNMRNKVDLALDDQIRCWLEIKRHGFSYEAKEERKE